MDRDAERRYRDLIERLPAAVYIESLDETEATSYISPEIEAMLGYSRERWTSDSDFWRQLLHPDDRERMIAGYSLPTDVGDRSTFEYRLIAHDNRVVWVRDQSITVRDESTGAMSKHGLLIDITEQKQTSQALAEAEARYRALVEQLPAVVYRSGPSLSDNATYMSPAVGDLLGCTVEEFLTTPGAWLSFIHPDDRDAVIAADDLSDTTGEPFAMEYRVVARDGRVIWVRDEAICIRDAQGRPLYWQGFWFDVTEQRLAAEELQINEARFRSIFEHGPIGMALTHPDGRWIETNAALCSIVGYSQAELLAGSFQDITHPEDLEADLANVARVLAGQVDSYQMEKRYIHKDGHVVWVLLGVSLVRSAEGEPLYLVSQIQDITGRKHVEERFRAIFNNAAVGITLVDPNGEMVTVNPAFQIMLGYTEEELRGVSLSFFTHPDDAREQDDLHRQLIDGAVDRYRLEKRYVCKDGTLLWGRLTVSTIRHEDGRIQYVVGMVEDISEQKNAETSLRHLALHDSLTALPNRTLLTDRLEQALRAASRDASTVALLLMDLNGFKEINDTFGHHAGDMALQYAASRVQHTVRDSDTLARLGGDEFALVLNGPDESGAQAVVQKIHTVLGEPFQFEGHRLRIVPSIGIALSAGDIDAQELFRRADVAMYTAKRTGRDHSVYSERDDIHSEARASLAADLRETIQTDGLFLHYQPKVDTRTGALDGVEALARWRHQEHGLIPPSVFIPIAERSGLIPSLTNRVLDMALRQSRAWYDAGVTIKVAVNLSTQSLYDPDLDALIAERIRRWAVAPSWLTLEITESAVMIGSGEARVLLEKLRAMGIGLSIDDFGTGYSSFAYLKLLPVSEIKIDRSFIKDMLDDAHSTAIVRSIVELGHGLELRVVAEGIEDAGTMQLLQSIGCDLVQGYHVCHPLPADDLASWALSRQQPLSRDC